MYEIRLARFLRSKHVLFTLNLIFKIEKLGNKTKQKKEDQLAT